MSPLRTTLSFAGQCTLVVALTTSLFAQTPIVPGNLVVVRVGSGAAALSSAATPQFLEQFLPDGTPAAATIALPTTLALPQLHATVAGSATSEGFITQSADGKYLVCVGYAADVATPSVAGTASAAVPRVVARIALDGTIDTSTCITNLFSGGNIRSATSQDGSQFWAGGSNSSTVLVDFAQTTGTSVGTGTTNLRVTDIANGQLFTTSGSGATTRAVNTVGVGVDTLPGQVIAPLNGMASGTASPYDFWFADPSTLYVADDRTVASGGGIQKWTESAGTWTLQYTLAPGAVSCRGLTGVVDETGTTLFATTTASSANTLVKVVDTGAGSTFTTLATAAANTAFRGLRFVRMPYEVSFPPSSSCPTSVGIPTIGITGGAPISGNASFALTVGNAPDITGPGVGVTFWATAIGVPQLGLIPGGVPIPDAPACALLFAVPSILLTGLTDVTGSAVIPVSLSPADNSLVGLPIAVQHAVFDFTGFYSSFGLPVGTTVGMQIVIGN